MKICNEKGFFVPPLKPIKGGDVIDLGGKTLEGYVFTLNPEKETGSAASDPATDSVTFEGVPVGATLTVREKENDTYTTTVKVGTGEEAAGLEGVLTIPEEGGTITFTNTRKFVNIIIKKDDGEDTLLSGARFKLKNNATSQTATDANGAYIGTQDEPNGPYVITVNEQYTIENFPVGTYTLTEVKAPNGYLVQIPDTVFTVTAETGSDDTLVVEVTVDASATNADADGNTLTIHNTAGVELPHTGGSGTTLFTLGGMAFLTLAALMGYCESKRKRHERRGNAS